MLAIETRTKNALRIAHLPIAVSEVIQIITGIPGCPGAPVLMDHGTCSSMQSTRLDEKAALR